MLKITGMFARTNARAQTLTRIDARTHFKTLARPPPHTTHTHTHTHIAELPIVLMVLKHRASRLRGASHPPEWGREKVGKEKKGERKKKKGKEKEKKKSYHHFDS